MAMSVLSCEHCFIPENTSGCCGLGKCSRTSNRVIKSYFRSFAQDLAVKDRRPENLHPLPFSERRGYFFADVETVDNRNSFIDVLRNDADTASDFKSRRDNMLCKDFIEKTENLGMLWIVDNPVFYKISGKTFIERFYSVGIRHSYFCNCLRISPT